jgi:hypothetical protein
VQPDAALRVRDGIRDYLVRHGLKQVSELIGALDFKRP